MKVTTPSSTSRVGTTRRPDSRKSGATKGASEFSRLLNDAMGATEEVNTVEAPLGAGSIEALLAAQVIGDATDEESRSRMVRHGEEVLDRLEELQQGLLSGTLSHSLLLELERLVKNKRAATNDPQLHAVLDEIDLRAKVEIAKLERNL